ncbi:MAG: tripartite tricarboxylate transporter substrate binding protein [Burkholderiales bacterium]
MRTAISRARRLTIFLSCAALPTLAHGAYPDKPIRIIVPFAPGGNIDITARTIAPGLTEFLGQSVVVDNRGGAGGKAGTELAAKATPDGYTLLLGSSGALTMSPAFYKVGYDPIKDFVPTSLVSIVPIVLSVHPSLPVQNVKELIELARKRNGNLTMASAGPGSTTHLTGELFQLNNGIKFIHIPYKGSGQALIDVIGGQVDLIFDQISSSSPLIKAGKLKPLAIAIAKRSASIPSVPTMAEAGVPAFEASTYTGVVLPAAVPKEIVRKVYAALIKTLALPSTRDSFERLGAEVISSTPEEFSRRLDAGLAQWKRVQEKTKIELE